MCDYNQDSIEICSAQLTEADRKLLYTETDFSEHMHWWMLTDFCSHVSSHVDNVDNVTSSIMLLCQFVEDSVFTLSSRSNLELLIECSVTIIN